MDLHECGCSAERDGEQGVGVELWYLDMWTTCIPIVICGGALTKN